MRKLKTASLAILGAAAIFAFGPAMAKETMTKGKMTKGEITQGETTKAKMTKGGSKTLAKGQHHMQRHIASRGERFRSANAALTREGQYRRPVGAAGAAVGGAAATAGAIATAPFRAFGAVPATPAQRVSSSDRALYIKNLHDSGYDPKKNFNASGNLVTQ